RGGERLLDEHVLAGAERLGGQRVVRGEGRGDDNGVDVVVQQIGETGGRAKRAEATLRSLQRLGARVAHGDEVDLRQKPEVSGGVGAPVAGAGAPDANGP